MIEFRNFVRPAIKLVAALCFFSSNALAEDAGPADGSEQGLLLDDSSSIPERIVQDASARGALFRGYSDQMQPWYEWKERLSRNYGLDFTFSFTALYQSASNAFGPESDASGYDFDISGTWAIAGRGTTSPTILGFQLFNRDDLGTELTPQVLFTQYGGLYSSGAPFGETDFTIGQLYIQKDLGKK